MGIGYCIHCRAKVELKETTNFFFKNGVPAERGKCPTCDNKVVRILNRVEREELKQRQTVHKDE